MFIGAGCAAAESQRSISLPAVSAVARPKSLLDDERPLLYVASHILSEYALGSSEPLRSTKINYSVDQAALALDSDGHLFEANGNPSYEQLLVYDASSLRLVHMLSGMGGGIGSMSASGSGYLYAGDGAIWVFAPGATRLLGFIRRGARSVHPVVFDSEGNLYAGDTHSVSIYAPRAGRWRMEFVRSIKVGVNTPVALAVGPSGQLFVANWATRGNGWVSVYASGASEPERKITSGINAPSALVVDSTDTLYVANLAGDRPAAQRRGWVSVYAVGSTQLLRKITDGIYGPTSLALSPDGDLYVGNLHFGDRHKGAQTNVTVYNPGGSKLLYAITKGISVGATVLIGSPR